MKVRRFTGKQRLCVFLFSLIVHWLQNCWAFEKIETSSSAPFAVVELFTQA
jgi:hypothetical protein